MSEKRQTTSEEIMAKYRPECGQKIDWEGIEDCCANCIYCRTIKTPEITGRSVDYVCQNKGSVIYDINIKNCDEMFLLRTPKVRGKSNGKNLD